MRYREASPKDQSDVNKLLRSFGFPEQDVLWPTILAHDDDGLVGIMATTPNDQMVLAGPLVMRDDKRRPITLIRMVELYEAALGAVGVRSYIFHTRMDGPLYKHVKTLFEIEPYASDGENAFFHRRF